MKTIGISLIISVCLLFILAFNNSPHSNFDERTITKLKLSDDYLQGLLGNLKAENNRLNSIIGGPGITGDVNFQFNKATYFLTKLREKLINETGGVDKNGFYVGANEVSKVESIMIGDGTGNGYGYRLKKEINQCIDQINITLAKTAYKEKRYNPIVLDCKDNSKLFNTQYSTLDFTSFNFRDQPLILVLNDISIIEFEIAQYQNDFLNYMIKNFQADIPLNEVVPLIIPNSKIVDNGSKYEAEIFFGARPNYLTPRILVNGKQLSLNPVTKTANYSIQTKADSFDSNGLSKRYLKGELILKLRGKDSIFSFSEEYYIRDVTK